MGDRRRNEKVREREEKTVRTETFKKRDKEDTHIHKDKAEKEGETEKVRERPGLIGYQSIIRTSVRTDSKSLTGTISITTSPSFSTAVGGY
jgi:hypothetical protein